MAVISTPPQPLLTISNSSASKKWPHGPTSTGCSTSSSLNHCCGKAGLGQRRCNTSLGRSRRSAARSNRIVVCGTAACSAQQTVYTVYHMQQAMAQPTENAAKCKHCKNTAKAHASTWHLTSHVPACVAGVCNTRGCGACACRGKVTECVPAFVQ